MVLGVRGMVRHRAEKGVPLSNFTTRKATRLRKEGDRFDEVCEARISRKNNRNIRGCCTISKKRFGGCGWRFPTNIQDVG